MPSMLQGTAVVVKMQPPAPSLKATSVPLGNGELVIKCAAKVYAKYDLVPSR